MHYIHVHMHIYVCVAWNTIFLQQTYIYIYVYVFAWVFHNHMYVRMHVFMNMCMYVCMYAGIYVPGPFFGASISARRAVDTVVGVRAFSCTYSRVVHASRAVFIIIFSSCQGVNLSVKGLCSTKNS